MKSNQKSVLLLRVFLLSLSVFTAAQVSASYHKSGEHEAYITNSSASSVSVINTDTKLVVATIPVGVGPVNPTFTPDGKFVYVANTGSKTISVIDTKTHEVKTIQAGGKPSGLAFLPGGKKLLVTLIGETAQIEGFVEIITIKTGEISTLVPVGKQPERVALSADGKRAYVAALTDGSISVVDVESMKVIKKIPVGKLPFNMLISPDGKLFYSGVVMTSKLVMINTQTLEKVDSISTPTPNGLIFSKDFKSMYVTNVFAGTIQEISLETKKIVRTADAGKTPGYIALLSDGMHICLVRPFGDTVDIIDLATLKITDTIKVEKGPSVVAVFNKN